MADKSLISILRQGVEKWNAFRSETDLRIFDLKEANLKGANLKGANLKDVDLERAILEEANLQYANLEKAILEETNLRNSNLEGANLKNADLERAELRMANLKGANLDEAKLRGTDLIQANLEKAKLRKAILKEADPIKTDLTPTFIGLTSSESHIPNQTKLLQANLKDADLERAELKMANLNGANLHGVNLNGADLKGAELREANLKMASIRMANLMGADLERADLTGASLFRTCLSYTTIRGTTFVDADLSLAAFTESKSDHHTRFSDSTKVAKCLMSKSTLDALNDDRGGLQLSQVREMIIKDDFAELKKSFSGFWKTVHVIALFIFLFPYLFFLGKCWAISQGFTFLLSEDLANFDPNITVFEAFWEYIYTLGTMDGQVNPWIVSSIVMLLYNLCRVLLLWKTVNEEHIQEITGVPSAFKWNRYWKWLFRGTKTGFFVAMLMLIAHTKIFMDQKLYQAIIPDDGLTEITNEALKR